MHAFSLLQNLWRHDLYMSMTSQRPASPHSTNHIVTDQEAVNRPYSTTAAAWWPAAVVPAYPSIAVVDSISRSTLRRGWTCPIRLQHPAAAAAGGDVSYPARGHACWPRRRRPWYYIMTPAGTDYTVYDSRCSVAYGSDAPRGWRQFGPLIFPR